MFGAIYSLIVSAGLISNKVKENIANQECREKYKCADGLTYTDIKGHSRLLSNDEQVMHTWNEKNEFILMDMKGRIIKNFTEEKKQQKQQEIYEKARKNNETTYCIDEDTHTNDYFFGCQGKRFKDFATGEIYVIRNLKFRYYYMNIKTGHLVRKTDWQIKREKEIDFTKIYGKGVNIEEFNKMQDMVAETKEPLEFFRNSDYHTGDDYYK